MRETTGIGSPAIVNCEDIPGMNNSTESVPVLSNKLVNTCRKF